MTEPSLSNCRTLPRSTLECLTIMPSGQTQKVYEDEQPLAPESVRDIHRMLGESRLTSQIRKHRTVSGVMFFEVSRAHWIERRGYAPYFRYHLVAGEDPKEKGCLVSMHLSRPAQYLIPLHMKSMWDTRGGIPNIAWCSAFQFKRKIFPSGTNSRSYTAIRRARRDYCKELLRVFDDSLSFENQNWQAIQVCHSSRPYHSLSVELTSFRLSLMNTKGYSRNAGANSAG